MWVISRVTVLLPFVPDTDTIGMRRSASRIQVGGVASRLGPPGCPAIEQRAAWASSAGRVRDGETSRSASATAASAMVRGALRADPREGDDPVAGIGRPMDAPGPPRPSPWSARSRRTHAAIAATPSGHASRRHPGPEPDQRVPPRIALAVERPPPADGEFQLDHRLQPVDVGPLEETGLDQSHGPRRIPSGRLARLRPWTHDRLRSFDSTIPPSTARARGPARRRSPPTCPSTSPTSSASSTSTAAATPRRRQRGRPLDRRAFLAELGAPSSTGRSRRRSSATPSSATFERRSPAAPTRPADRPPRHGLRSGHRRRAPVPDRGWRRARARASPT